MTWKLVCKDDEKRRDSGALNSLCLKRDSSIHMVFTYFLEFILDK